MLYHFLGYAYHNTKCALAMMKATGHGRLWHWTHPRKSFVAGMAVLDEPEVAMHLQKAVGHLQAFIGA